jgi:hypothetical protein
MKLQSSPLLHQNGEGGFHDPHQGLRWPGLRQGKAGNGEEQTAAVKLGVRVTRLLQSETGGGTVCGRGRGCS